MIKISPDLMSIWKYKGFTLNATILFTWILMAFMIFFSWLATRNLKVEGRVSRWQIFLEGLVSYMRLQIEGIMGQKTDYYLPFIGTLFLFISLSNFLLIVPGYHAPTGSLSTTAALALCVFLAVPIFGILQRGWKNYFRHYIRPTIFMLPFHVMGEITRTFALAIRLFGNIMSEALLGSILLIVAPLFFPILLDILGLIIGQVQAYIFSALAAIYIASGVSVTLKE